MQGGLNELSGLVASPSGAPILWGHNDSGDSARLFAISTADGTNIGEVKLTGANNDDWEDISSYRTNDGRNRLVIADTGDNDAKRNEVYLWVLDEPSANAKSAVADRVTIRFAEGPHDVETLFVDQAAGEVVLIGKRFGSSHAVPVHAFALADLQAGGVVTPAVIGPWTVPAGEPLGPTGGDVSADGQLLALRLPFRMFIWKREPGVAFSRTLVAGNEALCRMVLGSGQLESAAFLPDRRLVTGSEGDGTPLVASAPL